MKNVPHSATPIPVQRLLVIAALAGLMGCKSGRGPIDSTSHREKDAMETYAWTGNECDKPWQAELGSGRVACVPLAWTGSSESAMVVTPEFAMAADYLGLYSQLRLQAGTPVEATVRGKGNSRSIHIMRFGPVDNRRSIQVDYEIPQGHHVAAATAFSPEFPAQMLTLTWKESNGRWQAELSQFGNYALIGIRLRK